METTKSNTPRRYGKQQILSDIERQNSLITESQLTMLKLNDFISMVTNLIYKGTPDRYKNTNKISDKDGKIIREAITEFNDKIKHIL